MSTDSSTDPYERHVAACARFASMHERQVAQALVNMGPSEARAAVNVLRQRTQAQCIAPVAITLGALAAGALVQKYVDCRCRLRARLEMLPSSARRRSSLMRAGTTILEDHVC
jgi:hypothetical protein